MDARRAAGVLARPSRWPAPGAVSLVVLGATAIAVQLVCLREVLSSFGGNELMAGLALGLWLLLTGIGSRIGAALLRPPPENRSDASIGARAQPLLMGGAGDTGAFPRQSDAASGLDDPMRHPRSEGRRLRSGLSAGHLLLAILPFGMLVALRAPLFAEVRGEIAGLRGALLGSAVIFLPFTFLSGGMIPAAGRLLAATPSTAGGADPPPVVRRLYILDSLGSAAGGLVFSLLLAGLVSHGRSLALFASVNLLAAIYLAPGGPVRRVVPSAVLAVLLLSSGKLDRASMSWRFPGQELLFTRDTPFGQIGVTRASGQETIFQDAIPFYTTGDLAVEARVHPAMCQVPEGASVFLLGGGGFGAAREVLRHRPSRIDCVEADRSLLALGDDLNAPLVTAEAGDGRRILRSRPGRYDAVLVDLPGPQNTQLNRYYTAEFFQEAHASLRPGGILSFPLPSSPDYIGPEQIALERSIHAALMAAFAHVVVLPGETHIFLASDRPIRMDVEEELGRRGIETVRLLDYDWDELSDPFRIDQLAALLAGPKGSQPGGGLPAAAPKGSQPGGGPAAAPVPASEGRTSSARGISSAMNRDLSPLAFRHFLDLERRKSGGGKALIPALAAGSLLALIVAVGAGQRRSRTRVAPAFTDSRITIPDRVAPAFTDSKVPIPDRVAPAFTDSRVTIPDRAAPESALPGIAFPTRVAIGTSGFAVMSVELGALLLFQVLLGNLYLRISVFVTLFLTGTALGAFLSPHLRLSARSRLLAPDLALAALAALLLPLGRWGVSANNPAAASEIGNVALPCAILLVAVMAGIQFAGAAEDCVSDAAGGSIGQLYLADLAGAAAGTIWAGLLLLPRFGIGGIAASAVLVKAGSWCLQMAWGKRR